MLKLFTLSMLSALFSLQSWATIELNGFASFYATKGLDKELPQGTTKHENFTNLSRVGLNLRSDFANRYAAIAQMLIAGDNAPSINESPDWTPKTDWAFLLYQMNNHVSFRIGRQLLPGSVTDEYRDVGLEFPFIRIPTHVGSIAPLKAFNGVSVNYQLSVLDQETHFRFYGGNEELDLVLDSQPNPARFTNKIRNLYGLSFHIIGNSYEFKVSAIRGNLDSFLTYASGETLYFNTDQIYAYTMGFKFEKYNFILYSQYGILDGKRGDDLAVKTGGAAIGEYLKYAHAGYLFLGYKIKELIPYYMFSRALWDIGLINDKITQHTFGLNYRLAPEVAAKFEYSSAKGRDGAIYLTKTDTTIRSIVLGVDLVF